MSTRYSKLSTHDQDHVLMEGPSTSTQQQTDLQDAFGESFEDDEEEEAEATDRLLPSSSDHHSNVHSNAPGNQDSDDEDDDDHVAFMPQPQPSVATRNNAPAILPISTDGVFANMSAKPESDSNKLEETPPTYEEAAADATPPYWQTTIIAPAGMGDIVLVEGMPVGNIFSFFWNLMISASFQFVGFMLTYLLHTSHASKQGSRAGLGISLVQTGFYIRSRGTLEDDEYYYNNESSGQTSSSSKSEDNVDADIVAYFLMIIGWFIIIRSLADYFRAKQMEKIICAEPTVESMV
ncbi:uncharacterized protein B0P05DRAFT_525665 [Gilbertella persicaria]|uniref:uncharacterized protein n=1 Tax=Gilbertella persicaria TaxID=101096 RepID=UPI002220BB10|nr:uncharacterized protein B0P05DRAFT_525665 [Gilbertella persicaria]KAI8092288.1 hypothetical protein B0P05DRAFT_525665 [Gilbertella persicaria]